ncbi:M15 family metallopeptidase [Microbacterium sp. M1A1_1b]
MSLAWGGFRNGSVPPAALHAIPNYSALGSGFGSAAAGSNTMKTEAAVQLSGMQRSFFVRFARRLLVSEGYRPLTVQNRYWSRYQNREPGWTLAAIPGTSIHGWGLSADLAVEGIGNPSGEYLAWLRANAAAYGFVNDVSTEVWHWSYRTDLVTRSVVVPAYVDNPNSTEATPAATDTSNINLEDDMPRLVRVVEPGNSLNGLVAFLFPDRVIRTGDNKIKGVTGSDQIYRIGRAWGLLPPNAKWQDHVENIAAVEFATAETDINTARGVARGEYAKDIAAAVWNTLIDVPTLNGKQTAAARVGGIDQLKQNTSSFSGQAAKDIAALVKTQSPTASVDVPQLAAAISDVLNTNIADAVADKLAARLRD